MNPAGLGVLVTTRSVIICCGPGGVGKTTTAAALGIAAARRGRRVCVVTIDPARRLADALGLDELSDTPRRIADDGRWPGELWGLMLDTRSTFDALITRYAESPEQAQGILSNRLYRNIAGALSGTQEYMAMEKLYELHADERFDLVVVDTPPSRNALDFLDAPRRLSRFLDNRVFRMLMTPTRAYLRAVSVATQTFLRTVSKVVGADVIGDAIAFFRAFEGMEQGFRERAEAVRTLLADPTVAFALVVTPRRDAVAEALFFAAKLGECGLSIDALVVNRAHPSFDASPGADRARAASLSGTPLAPLYANRADLGELAQREADHIAAVAVQVTSGSVVRVAFLADDVHDIAGLEQIAARLCADTGGPAGCQIPAG
ncbi:MAG: ArsA family ATPase [Acidimicrobiales bacterium]